MSVIDGAAAGYTRLSAAFGGSTDRMPVPQGGGFRKTPWWAVSDEQGTGIV